MFQSSSTIKRGASVTASQRPCSRQSPPKRPAAANYSQRDLQRPKLATRETCSRQLPPERPAAANCRQRDLQQTIAARETCSGQTRHHFRPKTPPRSPRSAKTSSAPHRVHLVAIPVHPIPPSQQIFSSRHCPPRTLSSHLDLPNLTSPHPANHLFDLQPIVEVQQDRTVCVQNCGLHCSCSEGFPHHWQENTSARGVGRLCLRWGLNLSPQLPKPEL